LSGLTAAGFIGAPHLALPDRHQPVPRRASLGQPTPGQDMEGVVGHQLTLRRELGGDRNRDRNS
jgi:hypothetical protein